MNLKFSDMWRTGKHKLRIDMYVYCNVTCHILFTNNEFLEFDNGSGIFYNKVVEDSKKKIIASLVKVLSRSTPGKT
jgi:hypothetical protein